MMNPSGDEFKEDEPLTASMQAREEQTSSEAEGRLRRTAHKVSAAAGDTWAQTKEKAGMARQRTEFFLRENPVPTILGALAVGLAIGLAIRYSSNAEENEIEARPSLGTSISTATQNRSANAGRRGRIELDRPVRRAMLNKSRPRRHYS